MVGKVSLGLRSVDLGRVEVRGGGLLSWKEGIVRRGGGGNLLA